MKARSTFTAHNKSLPRVHLPLTSADQSAGEWRFASLSSVVTHNPQALEYSSSAAGMITDARIGLRRELDHVWIVGRKDLDRSMPAVVGSEGETRSTPSQLFSRVWADGSAGWLRLTRRGFRLPPQHRDPLMPMVQGDCDFFDAAPCQEGCNAVAVDCIVVAK